MTLDSVHHRRVTDAVAVRPQSRSQLFERVVCGVDGSAAGMVAAAVGARLAPPDGELTLVHVARPSLETFAPRPPSAAAPDVEDGAERVLERARSAAEAFHPAGAEVLYGRAGSRLLEEVEVRGASLAVVGSHRLGRALGSLLGAVATQVVHAAACSVLVVRRVIEPARFPQVVLAGDDGSREAAFALWEAQLLAERFGARLRTIVATGGKPLDAESLRRKQGLEWDERRPVDALVAASRDADLVVVGSRGLHGIAALGSVSERVAHRAACSVLIVRPSRGR